jgi:hypothetical protein
VFLATIMNEAFDVATTSPTAVMNRSPRKRSVIVIDIGVEDISLNEIEGDNAKFEISSSAIMKRPPAGMALFCFRVEVSTPNC